jgi:hypothetical protein
MTAFVRQSNAEPAKTLADVSPPLPPLPPADPDPPHAVAKRSQKVHSITDTQRSILTVPSFGVSTVKEYSPRRALSHGRKVPN